jgi:penicillin-binding protein 2
MELREDIGPLRRRTAFLFLLVFGALGLLHFRLVDLQLVHGGEWRDLAENNRLRRLPLPGPRGWIYDRRGEVLAENIPSWELLLFPDEAENLDATGLFLAQAGVTDVRTFKERLAERRIGRMAPLVVGEDLSWNQVAAVRSHQSDYPELTVVSRFRRHYPYGELTSHVVGHLRPVSKEEVEADPGLEPDTMVGATGIEAAEDAFISGRAGESWVMVSAVGRQLGVVSEAPPRAGHDVGLTLDIGLQRASAIGRAPWWRSIHTAAPCECCTPRRPSTPGSSAAGSVDPTGRRSRMIRSIRCRTVVCRGSIRRVRPSNRFSPWAALPRA